MHKCNCFRRLAGELESWLQMMLRWSPKERGKDLRKRSPDQEPRSQDGVKDSEEDSKESSSEPSKDSPKASCFCFDELSRILNLKVAESLVNGAITVSHMSNVMVSVSSAGPRAQHDLCWNIHLRGAAAGGRGIPAGANHAGRSHPSGQSGAAAGGGACARAAQQRHAVCNRLWGTFGGTRLKNLIPILHLNMINIRIILKYKRHNKGGKVLASLMRPQEGTSSKILIMHFYYIYAFSRRFYPKWLTVHSGYTFLFCQYVCSLGIEPTTFALLTQCSTTESQEHNKILLKQ